MHRFLGFFRSVLASSALFSFLGTAIADTSLKKHVLLFIWDGLRPDSISEKNTPHLYALKKQGTWFSDNHSSYPTFTMMNAASFATGDLAGKTGFYGNMLWDPNATGIDASGHIVNFNAPVFTEDYHVLQDINNPKKNHPLFEVPTLFSIAQTAHLKTATIGKSGAAFIQDYSQQAGMNGINMDEKHVYPLTFAKQLQKENYPLPELSPFAYPEGALVLSTTNGNPTQFGKVSTLKAISGIALGLNDDFIYPDNVTSDPTATELSPYSRSNKYLMKTYVDKILSQVQPVLSVIWLRNPDTTEHNYGVGSPSYYTALHDQDNLLGQLLHALKTRHLLTQTNIIIASDHSHSNVSGPLTQFPLRSIRNSMVSAPNIDGYSVSGDFRPADLLSRAGFHAFDGEGCLYDPVLSGIKKNGHLVYPIMFDKNNTICEPHNKIIHSNPQKGRFYTTPAYNVPNPLPEDAIVVAENGGSTYLYVPSHNPKLIKKLTRYLQSRQEFGAVFIDRRYAQLPGTLPLSLVRIQNENGRNPDIIVGSSYDNDVSVTGMKGIEFNSGGINRGMHGSFSRVDVHNTLLAVGPDFKENFVDPLPTGNIDVAPTIAYLLGLTLPDTDGRPLLEALRQGRNIDDFTVLNVHIQPKKPAIGLTYQLATNPDGKDIDPSKTKYNVDLFSKLLMIDNKTYPYIDEVKEKHY